MEVVSLMISPHVALIKDQVRAMTSRNVTTIYAGGVERQLRQKFIWGTTNYFSLALKAY